jgi:hypothetical protein
MPIVTMPDGVAVDFGEMPDDQIRSMILQKFPHAAQMATSGKGGADAGRPPPPPGYGQNLVEMATEGAGELGRGVGQLHNAWDFATSGSGRNMAPDNPAGRVQSGFSALDKGGPQTFTEGEHRTANRQAVGDLVSGFGNAVSGGLGAAYSPVNAAFRTYVGQPVERATGSKGAGTAAEIGAGLFGPAAITRAARTIGRTVAAKPSAEAIQASATTHFESPAIRNLELQPAAVQSWTAGMQNNLSSGLGPRVAPKTWGILDDLNNAPQGARTTGFDLQALRQNLANVAKERGPDFQATPDAAAATRAIEHLDRYVAGGIRPRDVIAGNPAEASAAWERARGDYAQFAKIRAADRRQIQAEGNTGSAHSGLNFDNTMRQKMRDVATGPAGRGFTGPGEGEAVERIVHGSPERNAMRFTSALMGGGGGLGQALTSGGGMAAAVATGNPLPALVGPAGIGLRLGQNALTARDMDRLNAVLRANSPLARERPGQDIARALMGADLPPWAQNAIATALLSGSTPVPGK